MDKFATLYEYMVYTKGWTYLLMGVTLFALWGFWHFLTGRDKKSGRP